VIPKVTYAQVVAVVPKEIAGQPKENAKEEVLKKIDPGAMQASAIRSFGDGVKFNVEASTSKAALELMMKEKIGDNFVVSISEGNKPKIKIVGLIDFNNMKTDEIEEAMRKQNKLFEEDDHLKIVKMYPSKKNENAKTLIVEVDAHNYEKLLKVGEIKIKWSNCRVFNGVDLMRCFKCSRYSHRATKCQHEKCCPKCSGNHTLTEHPKEVTIEKCINCQDANKKMKLGLDENHPVWAHECQTYNCNLKRLMKNMKC
jgi:hypothetical protein